MNAAEFRALVDRTQVQIPEGLAEQYAYLGIPRQGAYTSNSVSEELYQKIRGSFSSSPEDILRANRSLASQLIYDAELDGTPIDPYLNIAEHICDAMRNPLPSRAPCPDARPRGTEHGQLGDSPPSWATATWIDAAVLARTYYGLLLEHRSMEEIAMLLCIATALMAEWPRQFMHFVGKTEITVHRLFTNRSTPFWGAETTSEYCLVDSAAFSKAEIQSARQLLRAKLGRKETPHELKSFMSDGVARYLAKVNKEMRQDVEISPKHFNLKAREQTNRRRRLGNNRIGVQKLIKMPAEQLAKIAILKTIQTKPQAITKLPIQGELFLTNLHSTCAKDE